jgi:hypothetical protein
MPEFSTPNLQLIFATRSGLIASNKSYAANPTLFKAENARFMTSNIEIRATACGRVQK